MFMVKDRRLGMDRYIFTWKDPRDDGYDGDVIEGVDLKYDLIEVHRWPEGQPRPDPQLGRDPSNKKNYKVFKSPEELREESYEFVHSYTPFVADSWSDYRKRYSPAPEEYAETMTEDEWFDFLEEADAAARIRKRRDQPDEPKPGSGRDQVAEWVAKRHMSADGGIQQVWFLDSESPTGEIRLLEVSERFTGQPTKIEPIDFGLDVAGAKFKLLVADVSEDHLEQIKVDPMGSLPKGWRIDGARVWGRRGPLQ